MQTGNIFSLICVRFVRCVQKIHKKVKNVPKVAHVDGKLVSSSQSQMRGRGLRSVVLN